MKYGVVYDELASVSTNGYARLSGSVDSIDNTKLYDVAGSVDVILAPWWDDLETADASGYVEYQTLGAAPDRVFVVSWRCLQDAGQTPTDKRVLIFQLFLYETTNAIEFRYRQAIITGAPSATSSASVGVKRSTTGPAVAGNCRDFYGSDHALGGSGKTPFEVALSAVEGNDYPGDSANTVEVEKFYFRFAPPLIELPVEDIDGKGPFTLPLAGVHASQVWDPVPRVNASAFTTLEQLVAISLFSDARADLDDELPVAGESRRGFWGSNDGDNFGSRLWLLERAKDTRENRARAAEYAREALDWLVDDGLADSVEVTVEEIERGEAGLVVRIVRDDEVLIRFPALWERLSNGT